MSRIALLTAASVLFTLSACAQYSPTPNTASTTTNPNAVSPYSANDPDGDGNDKGVNYFPTSRPATGGKVFIFDPQYHAWAVYDEQGHRVNTGNASGGKLYCPDIHRGCKTIVGTFHVIKIEGANCKSTRFPVKTHGGAPMPYCMYFSPKGYAIHGSYELPNDGNESHGCVRVSPTSAKWLNEHFITLGTTVIILPYKMK